MTREETVKIIRIMVVWQMMLEEYSYQDVSVALKAYILSDDSGFAPSIGKLVSKIHTMTQPQELNEMEAWSLVCKAICNSTYNSVSEFEKLPPLVQKAVGLPDSLRQWAMTENLNLEMQQNVRSLIEKANFGSYSAMIQEKRQKAIESASERKQGEFKASEIKHEGVPMPERYKERSEDMRNENKED